MMSNDAYEFIIKEIDTQLNERMNDYAQSHSKGTNSIPFCLIQQIQLDIRRIVADVRKKSAAISGGYDVQDKPETPIGQ